jgi:branched-chain amino acid transport system substrate-binding protein
MKEKNGKFCVGGLMILLCALVFAGFLYPIGEAAAATAPDIKIAVVYPLSGVLSRNGNLLVQGIKAAMGWVNDNGGIKSLGGARLVPVIGDSGSTVEGAASAMERVSRDPDIVVAMGAYSSSLSLSATEITERLGIPHFDFAFIDTLHQRGFKWGFYVSSPSSAFGELGVANVMRIAKDAGDVPKTTMVVSDNQAAGRGASEAAKKYLQNMGVKVLGEEIWAMGTLTDATPVMQKVKNLNPDIVIFNPTSITEIQMCLMKRKEMDIKALFMAGGGPPADPSFRQIGADYLEGLICMGASFTHKLMPQDWIKRSLDQCRKEYSDEAWAGQELTAGWTMVPIIAEILELAGSRNHQAIWEVARKLDIHDVLATRAIPGQGMAFDEKGRIVKKYQNVLIMQWQGGAARVIYPPNLALATPIWVGKK